MLLATTTVMPSYGQVKIQDHGTSEEIVWSDAFYDLGRIAQEHVILVRTCEPNDGDVTVELHDADTAEVTGRLIYDGLLRVESGFISVSGVDDDSRETLYVEVGGARRIKVYGEPGDEPRRLTVVIR